MTVEEYRKHPALNFSTLAALDKGPQYLLKEEKEYTEAMKLGSAVDCLITDPNSFYEKFIIATANKPTGQLEYFVDQLLSLVEGDYPSEEDFITAYENTKQWNGGKLQASLDKFKERFEKEGKNYFKFVLDSQGKDILTSEDYMNCVKLSNAITKGVFTEKFFILEPGVEILYQTPIIFNCLEFQYKILVDYIKIDHNKKTISPADIKTMADSVSNFKNSIWKYRYDIQSSLYSKGVRVWVKKNYPDYKVEDFKFIVGSFSTMKTAIFNAGNLFDIGANGGTTSFGYKYKGWYELSNLYKWHVDNQIFDYTKEVYENNGEIILEV